MMFSCYAPAFEVLSKSLVYNISALLQWDSVIDPWSLCMTKNPIDENIIEKQLFAVKCD